MVLFGSAAFLAGPMTPATGAPSGTPTVTAVARYDRAGGYDRATALARDSQGNLYVTGPSSPTASSADSDYVTIKYDRQLHELWRRVFDRGGKDYPVALAVGPNDSVYVAGMSWNGSNNDYVTVKYDSQGNFQWFSIYDGGSSDVPTAIAVDSSGAAFVTGRSASNRTVNDYDLLTAKFTSTGQLAWSARYDGGQQGDDVGSAIAVDAQGNAYVTGTVLTRTSPTPQHQMATIKYPTTTTAEKDAQVALFARDDDYAYDITADAAGNTYVVGTSSFSGSPYEVEVLKYNAGGWQASGKLPAWYSHRTIGDATIGAVVRLDGAGGVYVAGRASDNGYWRWLLAKWIDNGSSETFAWDQEGSGIYGDAAATAIDFDGDGNPIIAGWETNPGSGQDYVVAKCATDGTRLWSVNYDGGASGLDAIGARRTDSDPEPNANSHALAVDPNGGIYVTGFSTGSTTAYDFATVRFDEPTDLTVTKSASAAVVSPGDPVTFTVNVDNHGGPASGVVLTDAVPAALTVTNVTTSTGTLNWDHQSAQVTVDSLPAGGSFTVAITARADQPGVWTNTASATSNQTDAVPADNLGSATIRVNTPPTSMNDSYAGWKNCPIRVAAPGPLQNDADADTASYGDALQFVKLSDPAHGTVSTNTSGAFTYSPASGYVGQDSFTYRAFDGRDYSAAATITLNVQDDATKPTCNFGSTVTQSSPTLVYVPATVTDGQSGVAAVQITTNSANCKLVDPTTGQEAAIGGTLTYDPTLSNRVLRVVKLNPSLSARVELRVTDCSGNVVVTDPEVATLEVSKRQTERVFRKIPADEHFLKLTNGSPGLEKLKVQVNGRVAFAGSLTNAQVLQLDLARWMKAENGNTVRVMASGPAGASATLLVGDASLAGASSPGGSHGTRATLALPR